MFGYSPLFVSFPVSQWFFNKDTLKAPQPYLGAHPLSKKKVKQAGEVVREFPGYAPTPLCLLDKGSEAAGVGAIFYKDESHRFHLKNFKALGGAYAVIKLVEEVGNDIVITSSTAGSHGRAIAWGAKMAGIRCVIYIAEGVSKGREDAMTAFGAEVIRVTGAYEGSFQAARSAAEADGWHMVCDTTFPGYDEIPLTIMQGYGFMVEEIKDQLQAEQNLDIQDLTHVFLQVGCGGFAAAIIAAVINHCKTKRPRFIIVEPEAASCVLESMEAGSPVFLKGNISTMMGGLEVAEVSLAAWPIIRAYCDAVLTISDQSVAPAMKALAEGVLGGGPIEAGESAPAGLIGALAASADPDLKKELGLDETSKVLVIGTEGAADADTYLKLTGMKPLI